MTQHKRVIYGPLDYLGDVGGLADALTGIGALLISLFHLVSGDQLMELILTSVFEQDNTPK